MTATGPTRVASAAPAASFKRAEDERLAVERKEKALADYQGQLGKAFEHEARLKDLMAKQAQLNAELDLHKHEAQVVAEATEAPEKAIPASFAARVLSVSRAAEMAP